MPVQAFSYTGNLGKHTMNKVLMIYMTLYMYITIYHFYDLLTQGSSNQKFIGQAMGATEHNAVCACVCISLK